MTTKSEHAPISEERLQEIEKACAVPCPSCQGEGKNEEGTWECKPCAGSGRWLTTGGGHILFQPARIAAYVDAKVKEALEEACKLERWSLRAVDCGDGDDHHYDGLETDPKGEWISLDSIRALLAERVGP